MCLIVQSPSIIFPLMGLERWLDSCLLAPTLGEQHPIRPLLVPPGTQEPMCTHRHIDDERFSRCFPCYRRKASVPVLEGAVPAVTQGALPLSPLCPRSYTSVSGVAKV